MGELQAGYGRDIGRYMRRYVGDIGGLVVDVHRQRVVSGGGVVLDDERLVDALGLGLGSGLGLGLG